MTMKLRQSERCPLHGRYDCCGRDARGVDRTIPKTGKWYIVAGVLRIDDPTVPRGYREKRTPAQMRELLRKKIREQSGLCALCGLAFDDFRQIAADHREPRGMGGARRDDHPDNIQAVHNWPCNMEKGSKRV